MDKVAELSGMRFGVEIETVGINRKDTVSGILTVVGGEIGHEGGSYDKWHCIALDGRKWNAVSDASIGRGNAEVVSPILNYPDDISVLQNVIRAIRKAGGKVNSSCGIHVHVDASCFVTSSGLYIIPVTPHIYPAAYLLQGSPLIVLLSKVCFINGETPFA